MTYSNQSKQYFNWLDWLRFIAAFMVLVVHVRYFTFVEYGNLLDADKNIFVIFFYAMTRVGDESVVMFFVISGFLVGGKAIVRIVQGKFNSYDYLIDRFVRIMLPLIPALILTLSVVVCSGETPNFLHLIGNLLSLQGVFVPVFGGNEPLWTLSYEVWFYILVYFVGCYFAKLKEDNYIYSSRWYLLSNLIPILMVSFVFVVFTYLHYVYLFCWLIGALSYVLIPKHFSLCNLLFSIVLCLYSIASMQINADSISIKLNYLSNFFLTGDVSRVFLSAGIGLMIQQLINLKPRKWYVQQIEVTGKKVAAISYTLYLTHYPILNLLKYFGVIKKSNNFDGYSFFLFIFAIAICVISAFFMYFLFERNTYIVKSYIKSKLASLRIVDVVADC